MRKRKKDDWKRKWLPLLLTLAVAFLSSGCGASRFDGTQAGGEWAKPIEDASSGAGVAFNEATVQGAGADVAGTQGTGADATEMQGTGEDGSGAQGTGADVAGAQEAAQEAPPAFQEYDVSLMALGDNLIHMGIVYTGKQDDGTYDYSFLFQDITDFLEEADLRIINQETILAGNERGFSGYPHFNSPTEVGDAIAAAGFQVVLHATNHAADQGTDGMDSCVEFWKGHPEVLMLGIHEPYGEETDEEDRINLLEVDGVTFAILNYTYGPNYGTVSKEVSSRLDILCAVEGGKGPIDYTTINPQVLTDIETADKMADVVVVCPHWGNENQTSPTQYQQEFARQMAQAGADLILGTHPHVVQPVEWVEADNGNRALCFYSLGNYVSTMKGARNMLEALAWVTFHVREDGVEIQEEETGILPLVCQYRYSPTRLQHIYLLEEYDQELASAHGIISYGGVSFRYEDLLAWSQETIGAWTLTREDILGESGKEAP